MAEFLFDQFGHRRGFFIHNLCREDMDKHKSYTHIGYEEQCKRVQIVYPGVGVIWYVRPDEVDHTK